MKILIDIGHPAHVHFFSVPIRLWKESGCDIFITSRRKEIATDLLDAFAIPHEIISSITQGSVSGMARELIQRDRQLHKIVKRERPDIMVGIGGIFIAHTGFLNRIPSIVFYDTENAKLSNLITYPFCSLVVVPECYQAWLPPWHIKYPGYHELSYLHPDYFQPDKKVARQCGLDLERPTFLVRTVSWQASHDLKEKGWSPDLLRRVVSFLNHHGKVIISAEGSLPEDLKQFAYDGPYEQIHHLMGHIDLFIGESATMASECAVMGVPAIYAANTGRGYTDEQEKKYGLVFNETDLDWGKIEQNMGKIVDTPKHFWHEKQLKLLKEKIDVAKFAADLVQRYPQSRQFYQEQFQSTGKL